MTMTEYEKKRLENIKENNQLLRSLGFKETEISVPLKAPKQAKGTKRKKELVEPTRKSQRTRGKEPEFQPKEFLELVTEKEPEEMDDLINDEIDIFANLDEYPQDVQTRLLKGKEKYQNLQIPFTEEAIKVSTGKVYTIAPFPHKTRFVTAAGDNNGNILFWDINKQLKEEEPQVKSFHHHSSTISKIMFDPLDNHLLYSSSYDGTIRLFEFELNLSSKLYSNQTPISCIDIIDNEIWFSNFEGQVGMIDKRNESRSINSNLFMKSEKKINTIHFNPLDSNYFTTAGLDCIVRLFDKRMTDCISEFHHEKSANSSFFNPTGDLILSTSFDDTLNIWNHKTNTSIPIYHNNKSGRWVQKLKAIWDDEFILIGNMKKAVDVYDKSGGLVTRLQFNTIPAVVVGCDSMIIGANASGKMTIWK
jgi:WD40 repeat protein